MSQSFKPVLNFESITPQTTKGDLIGRTTVGATRVPVGADNTVLTADASVALGMKWAAASANVSVSTLSGATTLPATSQILLVSGSTFAITLPSPTSNSGLQIKLVKTNDTATAMSITGSGFKGTTLCTQNESYELFCDGATYWVLNHYAMTGLTNMGGISLVATGGGASIGANVTNRHFWRREGQYLYGYYELETSGAGAAGTGAYQINFPGNGSMTLDTSLVAISTTTSVPPSLLNALGVFQGEAGGAGSAQGFCLPYSATQFRISGLFGGAVNFWGSAADPLSAGTVKMGGWIKIPIAGWGE